MNYKHFQIIILKLNTIYTLFEELLLNVHLVVDAIDKRWGHA